MSEHAKAIELLTTHDGERFLAAKVFIALMSDSDLQLMTGFCLHEERVRLKDKKHEPRRLQSNNQ